MKTYSAIRRNMVLSLSVLSMTAQAAALGDALDHWTIQELPVPQNTMGGLAIAQGNGHYVAVAQLGDWGAIVTSEDGIHWTTGAPFGPGSPILSLYDVAYGKGTFVAAGWDWWRGFNLYSSTDGTNWASHASGLVAVNGITFADSIAGRFVAVGSGIVPGSNGTVTTNRNILTSFDGLTWTAVFSGSPAENVDPLLDVAYGAGHYVALDSSGAVHHSTAGWSITGRLPLLPPHRSPPRVNYCNGLFIACTGTNLVSSNGLAWFPMVKDTTNVFDRVVYGNGLYAALSDSKIFTSTNGTNWIQRDLGAPSSLHVDDLVVGSRNLVAVGYLDTYRRAPAICTSEPFVALGLEAAPWPRLQLSGLQGRSYRIEFRDSWHFQDAWQPLITLTLSSSPLLWTDISAAGSQRFYRAVLLP